MEIEIIAVGDEVLYGFSHNTNASFISQNLLEKGFLPTCHHVVGDDREQLQRYLKSALARGSLIIMTGGLGPTLDDRTKEIVSEIIPLEGAKFFENSIGTAPGFMVGGLIALPGVPTEMREMFTKQVLPLLGAKARIHAKTLHFVGLHELQLDPLLREINKTHPHIGLGIYPGFSCVTVQLKGKDAQELEEASKPLLSAYGKNLFTSPSGTLSEALHLKLLNKKLTLSTAESCTGGALAAAFVAHPGASIYFQGSIVAYSNRVKQEQLDVQSQTLNTYGAVSEEVTREMALNIAKKLHTDLGIAVSGILGPTGGTPNKPVGTVCASIALYDTIALSWTMQLHGSRQHLLQAAVQAILAKLYTIILPQSLPTEG